MIIRLGYACICKSLDNVTSSSNYTYTRFKNDNDFDKLDMVIKSNLIDLIRILEYNRCNNVHFYRMSSAIIPLSTHPQVKFSYGSEYDVYYKKIANILKDSSMRVDMHPSVYCILNSTKEDVRNNAYEILKYHYDLLDYMGCAKKLILIHVGSSTFGKEKSLTRFINNFNALPSYLQECIAIENDDKVFTIDDCLYLSRKLNIPVVLDYHHFLCNNVGLDVSEYLEEIFLTWKNMRPKIHFSSPKNKRDYRAHNEFIDSDAFISFLNILKPFDQDVDIMLEAKGCDMALFRLVRELKYKEDYKFLDDTSFYV